MAFKPGHHLVVDDKIKNIVRHIYYKKSGQK